MEANCTYGTNLKKNSSDKLPVQNRHRVSADSNVELRVFQRINDWH